MVAVARFDDLRSLASGGISASYAAVGAPFDKNVRIITLVNNTEGDMLFTTDNTTDQLFLAAGSFKLYDIQANMNAHVDDKYILPIGMQFYVKQSTAPVSGSVYIEAIY